MNLNNHPVADGELIYVSAKPCDGARELVSEDVVLVER